MFEPKPDSTPEPMPTSKPSEETPPEAGGTGPGGAWTGEDQAGVDAGHGGTPGSSNG